MPLPPINHGARTISVNTWCQKIFLRFFQGKVWQRTLFPLLVFVERPWKKRLKNPLPMPPLEQGMLFFSNSPSLFNMFIWGKYSHVGIYDIHTNCIMEMTPFGMEQTPVHKFMARNCEVAIAKCLDWDKHYAERVVIKVKNKRFLKYDNEFRFNAEGLYCSELIYVCDYNKLIKCDTKDLLGVGWEYISPQGLLNADNVHIVRAYKA